MVKPKILITRREDGSLRASDVQQTRNCLVIGHAHFCRTEVGQMQGLLAPKSSINNKTLCIGQMVTSQISLGDVLH
jgi:hypothetical protein